MYQIFGYWILTTNDHAPVQQKIHSSLKSNFRCFRGKYIITVKFNCSKMLMFQT